MSLHPPSTLAPREGERGREMKIKVRGRRRDGEGRRAEGKCQTERDKKEKGNERDGGEAAVSLLGRFAYHTLSPFIIYTFRTHSRVAALTFLTRTVCVCVSVCKFSQRMTRERHKIIAFYGEDTSAYM